MSVLGTHVFPRTVTGGKEIPGMNLHQLWAGQALAAIIIAHGQTGIEPDKAAAKAVEYINALARAIVPKPG
jgi:hypothetical protein